MLRQISCLTFDGQVPTRKVPGSDVHALGSGPRLSCRDNKLRHFHGNTFLLGLHRGQSVSWIYPSHLTLVPYLGTASTCGHMVLRELALPYLRQSHRRGHYSHPKQAEGLAGMHTLCLL